LKTSPVPYTTLFRSGVVGVNQVDATGRLEDPGHQLVERLATGPGVAGVEDEPDAVLTDLLPKPGDPLDTPRHCLVTAGGVLDQHRDVGVEHVESLAPPDDALFLRAVTGDMPTVHHHAGGSDLGGGVTGVLQDAPARDAHLVVVGAQVDQVRGVDIDGDLRRLQLGGVGAGGRLAPPLGVGEENLDQVGTPGLRLVQRVGGGGVGAYEDHSSSDAAPTGMMAFSTA